MSFRGARLCHFNFLRQKATTASANSGSCTDQCISGGCIKHLLKHVSTRPCCKCFWERNPPPQPHSAVSFVEGLWFLPQKSADAAPVTQSLACSRHTWGDRGPWWEEEEDCCEKHPNGSQFCKSTKAYREKKEINGFIYFCTVVKQSATFKKEHFHIF